MFQIRCNDAMETKIQACEFHCTILYINNIYIINEAYTREIKPEQLKTNIYYSYYPQLLTVNSPSLY